MSERFSGTLCRTIVDAMPDGIMLVDGGGVIREVNERLESMFGYGREELVGQTLELLVPVAQRRKHVTMRQAYTARPRVRQMASGLDLAGIRKNGSEFPLEISLAPVHSSEGELVLAMIRDITHRRRLQDLGRATLQAAERERQWIAHELHDDTAQRLAAVLLRLSADRGPGPEENGLSEVREEIREAAEGLRRIARGLRPPALEDAGLAPAVRAHAEEVLADSMSIEYDLADVDDALDEESRLVVYRVLQEAVNNVARHAGATRVDITIARGGTHVHGTVRDNGKGFDVEAERHSLGRLGILGMTERATTVGGVATIHSTLGRGTVVEIAVPSLTAPEP